MRIIDLTLYSFNNDIKNKVIIEYNMETNKIVYKTTETTETTELIRAYWRKTSKTYYDTHKVEITRKVRERAAIKRYDQAIALIAARNEALNKVIVV